MCVCVCVCLCVCVYKYICICICICICKCIHTLENVSELTLLMNSKLVGTDVIFSEPKRSLHDKLIDVGKRARSIAKT